MNVQTITRPSAVEPAAAFAARRALETASNPYTVRSLYRAFRWAEAASDVPGISDDKVDALANQAALIWGMISRAPVATRPDAIAKLECVADTFERGERIDGTDAVMLRQVVDFLRRGALN